MIARITNAFPLWVLVVSAYAIWRPGLFAWFSGPLITVGLAVIMLGMGLTLGFDDAWHVASRRMSLSAGVVLQYTVMPVMGWTCAWLSGCPRRSRLD